MWLIEISSSNLNDAITHLTTQNIRAATTIITMTARAAPIAIPAKKRHIMMHFNAIKSLQSKMLEEYFVKQSVNALDIYVPVHLFC